MSLTLWLKKIVEKEMPAFRKTAAEVMILAGDPETGAELLGRLILQDPALTARVLRLSNSPYYNPTAKPIATVSRAVLVLGVDTVRSLCLSLALIEALLSGKRQDRVLADLGRSLHAAMQARALAIAQKEPQAEEIFIAALLYRVGTMVFWCFSEDEGVALDTMLRPGQEDAMAEKAVLGFSLAQLSHALVEDWKLSPLLIEIFRGNRNGVAAECILKGWEFAKLAEKGWSERATKDFVAKQAAHLEAEPAVVGANLVKVARDARVAAMQFGNAMCASAIPIPPSPPENDDMLFAIDAQPQSEPSPSEVDVVADPSLAAQANVLLGCFRELARLASEGRVSGMFPVVLKGIHEGLGVDRVVFATMVPQTDMVQGRSALGLAGSLSAASFQFTIRRQMPDSLSRSMEQGSILINRRDPMRRPAVVPDTLLPFVRGAAFLFAPVKMGGRVVGAYYCDCQGSGRDFSKEMIEEFQHIIQQLNYLLIQAAEKKAAGSGN